VGFILKSNPLPWLLEKDNPSVRFFTLTEIMNLSPLHPEVTAAKAQIMGGGLVPEILRRQKKGGYWEDKEDFYVRAKYRGTTWQIIILAELGGDGRDDRIKKACEFILDISQDRQSGAFCYRGNADSGGFHSCVVPCLTSNMIWSLIRLGHLDDPRVRRAIDWTATFLRLDDGETSPPSGWPYEKREGCWGKHTCLMGVVKALKAFAEIPERARSAEVRRTIGQAAEFLLQHHLFKRSRDLTKPVKQKWLRFGFPTMWDSDALEVLLILARLGYRDPRMHEAAELVLEKQDDQGRWSLENTFNGRFQVNIEQKGKPSKWVTLTALRALTTYFGR
jgi:hypothetical protein